MKVVDFQFDEATVILILRGLSKLPHEEVKKTIDLITAHANATLYPPQELPADQGIRQPPRRLRKRA